MECFYGAVFLILAICFGSGLSADQKVTVVAKPPEPFVQYNDNCSDEQVPCTMTCVFGQSNKNQDIHWAYTDESKVTQPMNKSQFVVNTLPQMTLRKSSEAAANNEIVDIRTILFFNETRPVSGRYTCMSRDTAELNGLTHTFEVSSPDLQGPTPTWSTPSTFCNDTTPCEPFPDYRFKCTNNTCLCAGYLYNSKCLPSAGYGQFCWYDQQCQVNNPNMICSVYYSECDCAYGYEYNYDDMTCEYDYWTNYLSWSATVAIVVSVVLLVIIICVFCMIYMKTSSGRRRTAANAAASERNVSDCNSECDMSSVPDSPPTYEEIGMSHVTRSETPPPTFDDIVKSRDFLDSPEGAAASDANSGFQVVHLEGVTVTEGHTNPAYDGEC